MDSAAYARRASDAAAPSLTEVNQAAGVILRRATDGTAVDIMDAVAALCSALGVRVSARSETFQISGDTANPEGIRDKPLIQYARALHATQVAVARLIAQGTIVPVRGTGHAPSSVNVAFHAAHGSGSTSGTLEIDVSNLVVPGTFQLTPGLETVADIPLLTTEKWAAGLGPLLTGRLPRLLEEALGAYRRGQYLSAATLIGSVAEGGWTRAGEMLRGQFDKLDAALDEDRIAEVQKRMAELFRNSKKRNADDLYSFATHVRTIRNYGIHPNAADNDAAEETLTEGGCFSLVQRTHAHLIALLDVTRSLR